MPLRGRCIGPNGESYNPVFKGHCHCDVEEDCKALKAAMEGAGTDEEAIIELLSQRTMDQRLEIRDRYKGMYGEDLIEEISSELSSNFKKAVKMLLDDYSTLNAKALYDAIKGAGTKESRIIEVLCTTPSGDMENLKEEYQKIASNSLEQDLKDDLSGDFERLCVALIQGQREEITEDEYEQIRENGVKAVLDYSKIAEDVEALYDAGEGRLGTDESTLIRIITSRHFWHLAAVDALYKQKYETSLLEAIDSETSGDFCQALKLALITCIRPIKAYSDLLRGAMAGAGTNDFTLMRVIITRREIDLKDICIQFELDQGQSLEQWVRDDTSGDYRRLLVALIGGQWRD